MVDFYVELLTKVYNVLHRSAFEDMPATFVVLFWINAVYTGIVGLVAFFRFNEDRMSVFSVATTVVYTIVHYAIITLLTFLTVFLHPIVTLIAMILTVVIGFMFTTDEDLESYYFLMTIAKELVDDHDREEMKLEDWEKYYDMHMKIMKRA